MKKYSKEIYNKEVIIKAAYSFTDECYIHLDIEGDYYLVELKDKNGFDDQSIYERFENELLAQETRKIVSEKTQNIREMIVARSLSSTIINKQPESEQEDNQFKAEKILQDWYETNE